MSCTNGDPLAYYASPGLMTSPKESAPLFDDLPVGVSALVEVVQGLLVHIFWAERYGLTLPQERQQEVHIRPVDQMLARIRELRAPLHSEALPISKALPLENRLVGNCRDFSVMLCSMLRHQGIPARTRCGFGTYFLPDHYEDHWVCEYWDADQDRWVVVDAQLDTVQRQALSIQFNSLDMPPGQFVTGGTAWKLCRAGHADPGRFGIFDMHGIWFVRGNLIRDFLSLNKVELLPWDGGWGLLEDEENMEAGLMDHIAQLCLTGDSAFAEIRATYENEDRFHIPEEWHLS